jgi:hypothetical protein
MPRSFELTAESPNSAGRIHAAFCDENYWRARLLKFADSGATLDSLTTDTEGKTTVSLTVHVGVEQLPPPLDRVHSGSIRLIHVETWYEADDGVVHGKIAVDAPSAPVSGSGRLTVTPVAAGSRLAGKGTVDVRVPLVGGVIAGVIAGQFASGIRGLHEFTDSWIAESG